MRSASKKNRTNFIEKTLATLVRKTERALFAEEVARKNGFLQSLDPRVKIVGFLALIIDVTLSRNFFTIFIILAIGILLAFFSQVTIRILAVRAWLSAFIFTGLIAAPVIFITPGDVLWKIPLLKWVITAQGINSATFLIIRVETTVTLSFLLVFCTLWTHILKGLRVLRLPVAFIVILGITYRYIFIMLETARNMFEARQSRLVGPLDGKTSRRVAFASVGVLLTKSIYLNTEIFMAMQSRGFNGEVYILDDFAMQKRDWNVSALFLLFASTGFWLGRQDSLNSLLAFL